MVSLGQVVGEQGDAITVPAPGHRLGPPPGESQRKDAVYRARGERWPCSCYGFTLGKGGLNEETLKDTFSWWLRRGKLQKSGNVGRTQPKEGVGEG